MPIIMSAEALMEMVQGRAPLNSSGSSEEDEEEYDNEPDVIEYDQVTDIPYSNLAMVSQR